jgi:uncharacterized membrane protein YkoI
MRRILASVATCALVVLATAAVVHADEEKVALDKLPKAVKDAIKAKFPDAELVGAEKETENGKTQYEVSIKNKKDKLDVILSADGKIVAIEKEIEAKELPKPVTAALDAKYPKATIKKVEEITKDDKVTFEVLIETADKKKLEVVFDPKGKIVEEEKKDK